MNWVPITTDGPFPIFDINHVVSEPVLCYTANESYLLLLFDTTKGAWTFLNGNRISHKCDIRYWARLSPPEK